MLMYISFQVYKYATFKSYEIFFVNCILSAIFVLTPIFHYVALRNNKQSSIYFTSIQTFCVMVTMFEMAINGNPDKGHVDLFVCIVVVKATLSTHSYC